MVLVRYGGAGALGNGTLTLNGGILDLEYSGLALNRPTVVGGNASMVFDAGGYTFGTLAIGGQTLDLLGTANSSGAVTATFGATTLSGTATLNVVNPGMGGTTKITLGAVGESGTQGLIKTGNGFLVTGSNTYSGPTTVNGGILQVAALGGSGRNVTVAPGATIASSTALGNAFLNRLVENSSAFTVALAADSGNALDFSSSTGANLPNASLGVVGGAYTYYGALTPNNNTYRLGGGDGNTLTVSSALTGSGNTLVVSGPGIVRLTSGSNTFGSATVNAGGMLSFSAIGAAGASGRNITVASGGMVGGYALNNAFLNRLAENSNAFTVALGAASGSDLDFSSSTGANLPNASLGVVGGSYTYSGTLTPNGGVYRLGGGDAYNRVLTVTTPLSAGNSLVVSGAGVTLQAASGLDGTTSVSGPVRFMLDTVNGAIASSTAINLSNRATLYLNNTSTANNGNRIKDDANITVNGGGTLQFANNAGAANYAETVGSLTVNSGQFVFETSNPAAGQTNDFTFSGTPSAPGTGTILFRTATYGTAATGVARVFFSGQADLAGDWLGPQYSVGGGFASYSSANGVTGNVTMTTLTSTSSDSSKIFVTGGVNTAMSSSGGPYLWKGLYVVNNAVVNLNGTTAKIVGGGISNTNMGATISNGTLTSGNAASVPLYINLGTGNGCNLTISAVIADNPGGGSLSLIKGGAIDDGGTGGALLILSGANTYSGDTIINAWTLVVANSLALQNSTLDYETNQGTVSYPSRIVFGNGTPNITAATLGGLKGDKTLPLLNNYGYPLALSVGNNNQDTTYSGTLCDTGSLNKVGTGKLTLTGANTYTGATTVSGGTLELNTTGAPAISGNLAVAGGTARLLQSDQIATGRSVSVSSGALDLGANSNTLAGVQLTGGSITGTTGTLTSTTAFDVQAGSVSAKLAGAVGLTKQTAGTVILSGANTYTGGTTISQGTLSFANVAAAQPSSGPATTVAAGASLGLGVSSSPGTTYFSDTDVGNLFADTFTGNLAFVSSMSPTANVGIDTSAGDYTYAASVAATTHGLTKSGPNKLTLTGANAYTGPTTITGGTLNVGVAEGSGAGPLGNGGTINFTGGTLQYTSVNQTDYSGRFSTAGSQAISIDTNGQAVTFATALQGTGTSLAVSDSAGTGSLTLTGASSYTGGTTINSGALLQIGGSGTLGSGNYSAAITNNGSLVHASSAAQTFGGVLGGTGSLTKSGSGTLTLSGANTYSGPTAINGGTLNAGIAQNGTTSGPLGASGNITFGGGTLQFSAASAAWDPSARIAAATSTGPVAIDTNSQSVTFATGLTASQSGGLTKTGAGTLTLRTAQNYTGPTVISGGTLKVYNESVPSNLNQYTYRVVTGASSGISSANTYTHAIDFNGSTTGGTLSNPINGVTFQNYFGTSTMTGSQGATGATSGLESNFQTNIPQGTYPGLYALYNDFRYGANPNNITLTGLTPGAYYETRLYCRTWSDTTYDRRQQLDVYIGSSVTSSKTWTVNEDNPLDSRNTADWNTLVTNNGGFTAGTAWAMGYVFQADAAGKVTIKASQVGGGSFHIYGLTNQVVPVAAPSNNYLPTTTALSIASGSTLDLYGGTQTVASLADYSGGGGSIINGLSSTTSTLTVNPGAGTTFSGVIANNAGTGGTVAFTKSGSGTQTLSGANTYTGATTISGGKLLVNGSLSSGGAAVSVASGATLGGTGTISRYVDASGILSPGDPATNGGVGLLTIQNDLDTQSSTSILWDLGTLKDDSDLDQRGVAYDGLNLTGTSGTLGLDPGTTLTLAFAAGLGPDQGNSFWTDDHSWKVIDAVDNANTSILPGITNGSYTAGTFGVSVGTDADAGDIFLVYTANNTGTFSGTAKWIGADGAAWGTGDSPNWVDTTYGTINKAPGSAPIPPRQIAVFNGIDGAETRQVQLAGANPLLNSISFTPDSGFETAYTIDTAEGGKITLQTQDDVLPTVSVSGTSLQKIDVPVTLANDTEITAVAEGSQLEISQTIDGAGILTKAGLGTLTLSGSNDYGGTVVTGGTLVIGSAGALPPGKSLSIGSGGTLIFGGGMAMGQAASAEAVPEPGTLALLAIAALAGAMIWRKRK